MPCYYMRVVQTNFTMENAGNLKAVLKEMNVSFIEIGQDVIVLDELMVDIDLKAKTASYRQSNSQVERQLNKIKQEYAAKTITALAKKKKWSCIRKGNKVTVKKY